MTVVTVKTKAWTGLGAAGLLADVGQGQGKAWVYGVYGGCCAQALGVGRSKTGFAFRLETPITWTTIMFQAKDRPKLSVDLLLKGSCGVLRWSFANF